MGWNITLSIGGNTTARDVVRLFETAADMDLKVEQTGSPADHDLEKHGEDIEAGRLHGFIRETDGTLCFEEYDHSDDTLEDLEMLCEELGLPFNREIHSDDEADGSISWSRPGIEEMGSCAIDHDGRPTLGVEVVRAAMENGTLEALLTENTPAPMPPLKVMDAR